eukprot:1182122-Prorocentrum_minimum.AAC.1
MSRVVFAKALTIRNWCERPRLYGCSATVGEEAGARGPGEKARERETQGQRAGGKHITKYEESL